VTEFTTTVSRNGDTVLRLVNDYRSDWLAGVRARELRAALNNATSDRTFEVKVEASG